MAGFISPVRSPIRSPLRSPFRRFFSLRKFILHGNPFQSPLRRMRRPGGAFVKPNRRAGVRFI